MLATTKDMENALPILQNTPGGSLVTTANCQIFFELSLPSPWITITEMTFWRKRAHSEAYELVIRRNHKSGDNKLKSQRWRRIGEFRWITNRN